MIDLSQTKTALLGAAEELFSERGYSAVGIRELAAKANTNVSSIKYHFGSKRQLYLETIRWQLQQPDIAALWDLLELMPTSPEEAATVIVQFVRGAILQAVEGGNSERRVRLMLQEALQPGEDFEFIIANFSAPYERLMVGLIQTITPGQSDLFYATSARGVFAQCLHHYIWKSFLEHSEYGIPGVQFSVQDAGNELARFVLRGLGCPEACQDTAMSTAHPPS